MHRLMTAFIALAAVGCAHRPSDALSSCQKAVQRDGNLISGSSDVVLVYFDEQRGVEGVLLDDVRGEVVHFTCEENTVAVLDSADAAALGGTRDAVRSLVAAFPKNRKRSVLRLDGEERVNITKLAVPAGKRAKLGERFDAVTDALSATSSKSSFAESDADGRVDLEVRHGRSAMSYLSH
jgi:hypothetical protein